MEATRAEIAANERQKEIIEAQMSETQERIAYIEQKIESSKLILLQYLQVIYTK